MSHNKMHSVAVTEEAAVTLTDCILSENECCGLQIASDGTELASAVLHKCDINRNTRAGVWAHQRTVVDADHCQLRHNGWGAGAMQRGSFVTFSHCQILQNSPQGLMCEHARIHVIDCQLSANAASGLMIFGAGL